MIGRRMLVPQAAVQRIQAMIIEKGMQPGERLPPQRELAEILQISRASLREALTALETLGLVRIEVGRGVFVMGGPNPDAPAPKWRYADRYSLREVYEARLVIEPQTASLAAAVMPEGEMEALARSVDRLNAAFEAQDLVEAGQADSAFHQIIVENCGNRMLAELLRTVESVMAEIQRLPFVRQDRLWETVREHEAIVRAIRVRNPAAAAQAMTSHIAGAAERLGVPLGG